MGSENSTSDLAGVLHAARRAITDAKAEVDDALREAHEEVAGAREQVALLQEVVRTITDVDTIKALADTTRLAILRSLSRDGVPKSAKELAEDLDQPQTKLYRHLKVLQEAGLIEPAETRVVSGIVETKYRAMQSGVSIDPRENLEQTREAMSQIIGDNLAGYRARFMRNLEEETLSPDPEEAKRHGMLMFLSSTVSPEAADDFHRRLEALLDEFHDLPRDPDGVRIEGLVSLFSPRRSPGDRRSEPEARPRPEPGSA